MANGVNAQRLLDIVRVDDELGNGALRVDRQQKGDLARLVGLGNAERKRKRKDEKNGKRNGKG